MELTVVLGMAGALVIIFISLGLEKTRIWHQYLVLKEMTQDKTDAEITEIRRLGWWSDSRFVSQKLEYRSGIYELEYESVSYELLYLMKICAKDADGRVEIKYLGAFSAYPAINHFDFRVVDVSGSNLWDRAKLIKNTEKLKFRDKSFYISKNLNGKLLPYYPY